MTQLLIVHGTTRPGRKGIHVSRALSELAQKQHGFTVDLVDLHSVNLPFFNEEGMPRAGAYELPHTLDWAKRVAAANAIVWATSEYNGGYPAPLKNAIDYLYAEWTNTPLGIISWSSNARGGSKAAAALRGVAEHMQLELVADPVPYPEVMKDFNEAGHFTPSHEWTEQASNLLTALDTATKAKSQE